MISSTAPSSCSMDHSWNIICIVLRGDMNWGCLKYLLDFFNTKFAYLGDWPGWSSWPFGALQHMSGNALVMSNWTPQEHTMTSFFITEAEGNKKWCPHALLDTSNIQSTIIWSLVGSMNHVSSWLTAIPGGPCRMMQWTRKENIRIQLQSFHWLVSYPASHYFPPPSPVQLATTSLLLAPSS